MVQRQPSVGNVLARTSSFGSASGVNATGAVSGNSVTRQGSQTSLFEQFASTAKELVRETTRQSSQDGLLAQMDKVRCAELLRIVAVQHVHGHILYHVEETYLLLLFSRLHTVSTSSCAHFTIILSSSSSCLCPSVFFY